MDALPIAKGTTLSGGILGGGTGIYVANSSNVYVKPEFIGKVGGKLVLGGKEVIEEGDSSGWNKVGKRYSAYLAFKGSTNGASLALSGISTSPAGSDMNNWCKTELLKEESKGDYNKAEKWCTKHVTMEDQLKLDSKDVSLSGHTKADYEKLLSKLGSSADDKTFLSSNADNDGKKASRATEWCKQKANIDYEVEKSVYSVFKEVCGKAPR